MADVEQGVEKVAGLAMVTCDVVERPEGHGDEMQRQNNLGQLDGEPVGLLVHLLAGVGGPDVAWGPGDDQRGNIHGVLVGVGQDAFPEPDGEQNQEVQTLGHGDGQGVDC